MSSFNKRSSIVLLVEDKKADQRLVTRALQNAKIKTDLHIVDDGEAALQYLNRQLAYSDSSSSPRPDLILLDMNLPRVDGKQVLKEVRSNPDIKDIPIVMLTTSDHEKDVMESYRLGVNAYITKPVDMEGFVSAIQKLEEFWFELVILPPNGNR